MDYNKWINIFMNAWKKQDVKAVIKTISKNCKYYETVFDEPCSSFEDIIKLWEVVSTNQKDIEFGFKIII